MPLKLADWRIHAIFLKQSPAVLSITPILAMGRIAPPKSPITMIAIRLATLASAIVLGVAAANAPTSLVAQAPLVNPTSSARPVRPDAERVPTLAAPVRNAPDDSSWSPPEPVAIDDPFLDDPQ